MDQLRPRYAGHVATDSLRERLAELLDGIQAITAPVENHRVLSLSKEIASSIEDQLLAIDGLIRSEYGVSPKSSQQKAGVWRSTEDGEKIYIDEGGAHGGGPNGPPIGRKNQSSGSTGKQPSPSGRTVSGLAFSGKSEVNTDRTTVKAIKKLTGYSDYRDTVKLVGAPDGSIVSVSRGPSYSDKITIQVQNHQLGIVATRSMETDPETREKIVYNESIEIGSKYRGSGIGADIFSQQVQEASAAGFSKIKTDASRQPGYNGYYTWARLGYDGPIPKSVRDKFPGVSRVSELMRTPEGRSAWKEHGDTFAGEFDLKPGSQSRRVLDAYMKAKRGEQ